YFVNEHAPLNSVIPTAIPLVGEYYGRQDLSFVPLDNYPASLDMLKNTNIEFIIVQISRIYFENIELVRLLQNALEPVKTYHIQNNKVVEIFQI
ncbi:MAG: hypothetical protein ACW99A_14970, partial [Candidatus Kariarchaeaceae archaeon]